MPPGLIALCVVLTDHPTTHPDETANAFPGFTAAQLPPPANGLVITSLRSGSEATRSGVAVGDELLAIDGLPIQSLSEAQAMLSHDPEPRLQLRLRHGGTTRLVTLHVGGSPSHGP